MRTVRNVHRRIVEAPADAVGLLIDRLSAPDDPLFPTPVWSAMVLDRPLGVGADGGHGRARYRVGAYEPGRSVRFDTTGTRLGTGYHRLDVEPLGPDRCRITHVLQLAMPEGLFAAWLLAFKPVHDTIVEEILDNAERAALGSLSRPRAQRPLRARLFHRLAWPHPTAVPVPADARLLQEAFERPDFTDAWRMALAPGMSRDPQDWRHVLPFPALGAAGRELMLGKDASHLDFRSSVLVGDESVTLATAVRLHNTRGRLSFSLVRRVHPYMARRMLRRAHRRVALTTPPAGQRNRTPRATGTGDRPQRA
ncbi:DUF2867 domain-containing protein [Streptomyces sp. NPDC056670]|uniref:DUF2867 domain-containing protein n=1 Tax=Streptomyces sp. NPDC056670 TaxID=3345904 RepID=UPI0036B583B0